MMPNVYISLGVHDFFRDAPTTLLVTETGGEVTLGGLGNVSTSRLDMEVPISLDDGGKLSLFVPGE